MFNGMKYVYEVYKEKSFSKAAQNLYIAQPSLSAAIKKIEAEIGEPLFDRSTNPIRLTQCGREYIKSTEMIMEIEYNFSNYVNNLSSLKTGSIAIGASNLFASFILPPIISRFREEYPQVKISLLEANTSFLEDQLLAGDLDLVVDNNQFNSEVYSSHLFCTEHLILAVPRQFASNANAVPYHLSAQDIINNRHLNQNVLSVPLDIFQKDPFILLKSGNETRQRAEKLFTQYQIKPNVIVKLDQQITAYNIAGFGIGITFISDTLVKNVPPHPDLVYYKLSETAAIGSLFIYHKKSKYVTRAMDEFLKKASLAADT